MRSVRLLVCVVIGILFWQGAIVTASAQETDSKHAIIVQYHDGQTPDDITNRVVSDKVESTRTTLGPFQDIIKTIVAKLQGKELPAQQLARIETVEKATGVVATHELFMDDPDITDSYLITLEEHRSAEDAASRFRQMPEVESAEPAENLLNFKQ